MGDEGGQVAGEEHLAFAKADHDAARVALAGRVETLRVAGVQRHHGVAPFDRGHGCSQRGGEVGALAEVMGDELRDHLGVGLRDELGALLDQLVAECPVVLDDAVLDDHDISRGRAVGVCVAVRHAAMRGPARVSDAHPTRGDGFRAREGVGQHALPGAFEYGEGAVVVEYGDAAAVVAAILESLQAFEQDGARGLLAHVANDAAHGRLPLQPRRGRFGQLPVGSPTVAQERPFDRSGCAGCCRSAPAIHSMTSLRL